eukprot:Skav218376  [mRNA]  locus=scaffold2066:228460:232069:- [translate_table: standard]
MWIVNGVSANIVFTRGFMQRGVGFKQRRPLINRASVLHKALCYLLSIISEGDGGKPCRSVSATATSSSS